jgi:hypothetical protein
LGPAINGTVKCLSRIVRGQIFVFRHCDDYAAASTMNRRIDFGVKKKKKIDYIIGGNLVKVADHE